MNETKKKILDVALRLYNQNGFANTSIRQLAKEMNISHSNLIYHFPTHEEVIVGLHDQLLKNAISINRELDTNNSVIRSLFESTKAGFSVVYNYRFLFLELQYICSAHPKIKQIIISVEGMRSEMYRGLIDKMILKELMRKEEFEGEYNQLITLIKIYSDHWIVSSTIYDELNKEEKIKKYAYLLMNFLYPYLTDSGKSEFNSIQITAPKAH